MSSSRADAALLLRAVLLDPDDLLARHAFADHLEESGSDPARLTFTRYQLANPDVEIGLGHSSHPDADNHPAFPGFRDGLTVSRVYRNGFIYRVTFDSKIQFEKHARSLFEIHPITQVFGFDEWRWTARVPRLEFVNRGRRLVGLPPLEIEP